MKFSAERKFSGEATLAFSAIEATLLPNSFRITRSEDSLIELKGRGMQSTKEDPIRGATLIEVKASKGVLYLNASLGGVLFMMLFVCLFPVLLIGSFAITPLFGADGGVSSFNGEALKALPVWLVIGPLAAVWIRRRTISALEDMLENAVVRAGRR